MANAAPVPTATKPTNLKYPWENPRNPSGDCITAAYFVCFFFFNSFFGGCIFSFLFAFSLSFHFAPKKNNVKAKKKRPNREKHFVCRLGIIDIRWITDDSFIPRPFYWVLPDCFFLLLKHSPRDVESIEIAGGCTGVEQPGFYRVFFFKDHWARFHRIALSCGGLFRYILIFFSRTTDLTRPKWFTSRGLLWGPLLRFNLGTSWSFAFSSSAIVSFLYFRVLIFCFPLHSFLRVFPFALVSFFLFVCFCTTADPDAYRVLWTENDRVSTKLVSIIFFSFAKPETSGRNTTFDFIFPWWATTR